jgi:phage-related protein
VTFNAGRTAGRVSIRVVPDTTRFRRELKKSLDLIEKSTRVSVTVDKVKIDRAKLLTDIRRELGDGVQIRADARVDVEALIGNREEFEREVKRMVRSASRNKVSIGVAATTAAASAQLRHVTRPRWVEIFVRINKKSLAGVATTLAALSGARLTFKWVDDLIQQMKELDRNLPKFLGWTTGITSLTAGLFAATSGLVGVGQGLVSILPAFLVLPGLFLNAAGSVTALIVALKNSGTELAVLKGDMNELGDIINETFWGRARQPIIDLVQRLMPQLRTAFRDLSSGIGDFTAAMADSFGRELSNGRLASIFNGIAEGWRVLATGADGFAGALVSLSNIAAQYTPRLAGWFVRQANTFDRWLKAISEDGRLGSWMETAIDSMYDLWDATRGVAGVFSGLWRAADSAGSQGLDGFAKLMLRWEQVVNSVDFQRGLTAIFRGSSVAMEAFGDAIQAVGRLFSGLDDEFERFIGSAGSFFAGIIETAFDALANSPEFARGLDGLSLGLDLGLDKIAPALQPIADTFGNFLGLVGDLAKTILPSAAGAFADLMPAVDSLIGAVEDILPDLASAVTDISEELAPVIKDFIDKVGPAFGDALVSIAEILVSLAPLLSDVLGPLADILNFVTGKDAAKATGSFFDDFQKFFLPDNDDWIIDFKRQIGEQLRGDNGFVIQFGAQMDTATIGRVSAELREIYDLKVEEKGAAAAQSWLEGIWSVPMPKEVRDAISEAFGQEAINEFANGRGRDGGGTWGEGAASGIDAKKPIIAGAARDAAQAAKDAASQFSMYSVGYNLGDGIRAGIAARNAAIAAAAAAVVVSAINAAKAAGDINSPSRKTRREIGAQMGEGVALGWEDKRKRVAAAASRVINAGLGLSRTGAGADPAVFAGGGKTVNVNFHNPALQDWRRDMAEATDMAGVLL